VESISPHGPLSLGADGFDGQHNRGCFDALKYLRLPVRRRAAMQKPSRVPRATRNRRAHFRSSMRRRRITPAWQMRVRGDRLPEQKALLWESAPADLQTPRKEGKKVRQGGTREMVNGALEEISTRRETTSFHHFRGR
jgi:hypothetical protein